MDVRSPVSCPSSALWKVGTVRKDPRGSTAIDLPPLHLSVSATWGHFPSLCSAFHIGANAVSTDHCSGDLETCQGPNIHRASVSKMAGCGPLYCI